MDLRQTQENKQLFPQICGKEPKKYRKMFKIRNNFMLQRIKNMLQFFELR